MAVGVVSYLDYDTNCHRNFCYSFGGCRNEKEMSYEHPEDKYKRLWEEYRGGKHVIDWGKNLDQYGKWVSSCETYALYYWPPEWGWECWALYLGKDCNSPITISQELKNFNDGQIYVLRYMAGLEG